MFGNKLPFAVRTRNPFNEQAPTPLHASLDPPPPPRAKSDERISMATAQASRSAAADLQQEDQYANVEDFQVSQMID